MNDESLAVFVDGVSHYFETLSEKPASIGAPFLTQDINKQLCDYTGIIGISGNRKGSVFFSAPKEMLMQMITAMGVLTTQEEKLMDLVGEVSNTIAGNARRDFGSEFMLSVPVVIQGKSTNVKISDVAEIYVIPVVWRHAKANLIINLESPSKSRDH